MPSKIVRRIVAESGDPGLFEALASKLPPSDLQSLLLEVFAERAGREAPRGVLARARAGAMFAPSDVDSRLLNDVERCAFEAAEGFEAVELAPALPLGTQTVVGGIHQNNVVTTIRNSEMPGDPAQALALQAALRRRRPPGERAEVHLCAAQRVVRMQPFDVPGFSPHFKLFAMVSAGKDAGGYDFEMGQLRRHVACYLRFFRRLNECGFKLRQPLVEVSDHRLTAALLARAGVAESTVRERIRAHRLGSTRELLRERGVELPEHAAAGGGELAGLPADTLLAVQGAVFEPLRREFPEAEFGLLIARLEGFGYYPGLCLRISPAAAGGARYPIADGGFVDWTARLLANRKERLLASGIGIEFICRRYR